MLNSDYSRDGERWAIEWQADEYRDTLAANPMFGSLDDEFDRLALLQKQFDSIAFPSFDWLSGSGYEAAGEAKPIALKAYRILLPIVGRQAAKAIIHERAGPFSQYDISIKKRGAKGLHPVLRIANSRVANSLKRFRVGMAVMLLKQQGSGTVAAQKAIAGRRIREVLPEWADEGVGEITFGDFEDTRKHWQAWRIAAFERGWADDRAFAAELEGTPWPDNQFWLDEI